MKRLLALFLSALFAFAPVAQADLRATSQGSVPVILAKSSIPFVNVATGSIANNGVLTVGTALPRAYANAYFFLPAGAVAAGVPAAAAWLFTQCTTTTACTVFNNVYTTGTPTVPASPTAFATTGPGAYTGVTAEVFGPTTPVAANAMGANGQLWATTLWSATNNANAKTLNVRFSGNAGTQYLTVSGASIASFQDMRIIRNVGVTGSQSGFGLMNNTFGVTSATAVTSSVDTTAATTVVQSSVKGVATDNIVHEGLTVLLLTDGT